MDVIACVVTYNRKELLAENIKATLAQSYPIAKMLVVDNNSTDGTEDFLQSNGLLQDTRIFYKKLRENIGGAGGFYTATKCAYEMGADAIWLMDDDGRPASRDTLKQLVDYSENRGGVFFYNSLVICNERDLSFRLANVEKISDLEMLAVDGVVLDDAAPFNGTFISRALVERIGYPNRDFFIKGDENDYKSRAKKAGADIATIMGSVYFHPQLKQKKKRFLGRNILVSVEAPWKEYYRARNYTYMYKSNSNYKAILYELFFCKIYAVLSEGKAEQLKTCRYVIKGIFDGLRGKLGKWVLPG